jgi:hypothetical protein
MVRGTVNGKLAAVGEEAVLFCNGIHHVQRGEFHVVPYVLNKASSGDVTCRDRNRTPVTVCSVKT